MNILLLSNIYPLPGPENQGTKVCHFFAKEWVSAGHNVRVIHYQATYPSLYYIIAKLFRNKIASKTGAIVYTKKEKSITHFTMDGVNVSRIPLQKKIPHGKFPINKLKDSVKKIIGFNKENTFVPDIILGHFINPQLEVLNYLKKEYNHARTGLIFHLPSELIMAEKLYGKNLIPMLEQIDILGFRNEPLKRMFKKRYAIQIKSFICYSGIPEEYIAKVNLHKFVGPLCRFLFVGGLIERKYPVQVLDALIDVYKTNSFTLDYVGDGQEKEIIKKRIIDNNLNLNVSLHGKINRDAILSLYDKSDCIIMISREEAFGLVYLEAMARGCIVIASRDEGMDGIIVDGYNGFLCKAGDSKELARIIMKINTLSSEEKSIISNNAIKTACLLTDKKVANRYLNDVINE